MTAAQILIMATIFLPLFFWAFNILKKKKTTCDLPRIDGDAFLCDFRDCTLSSDSSDGGDGGDGGD